MMNQTEGEKEGNSFAFPENHPSVEREENDKEISPLISATQPIAAKTRKMHALFENYGLEFLAAKNNEGTIEITQDENEEDDGKEERELPLDEEVESKQLFKIALINFRLTMTDGMPQFIPGCDYLAVGSIGSAYNYDNLVKTGITHILCLSEVIKLRFPDCFCYKRIPLCDKVKFDLNPFLEECFLFIQEAKNYIHPETKKPGKILVHCYQGISRSVTIVCAYLMRYGHCKRDDALDLIRSVRPRASPNSGFMTILKKLEEEQELIDHSKELTLKNHNCEDGMEKAQQVEEEDEKEEIDEEEEEKGHEKQVKHTRNRPVVTSNSNLPLSSSTLLLSVEDDSDNEVTDTEDG
jgi:protein-tyrosine phosphatase